MIRREEIIGDCTLILGDMLDVLPTLGRFDACVTDPPYGIGIAANPVRKRHEKQDWDASTPTDAAFDLINKCSENQIIWGGNYFHLPPSQGFLVWDKVQPEDFSLAMVEQAWCSVQAPARLYRRRVVGYEKLHPTQKPTDLMEWCIGQLPSPRTIVDPFMGSGTTLVACARMGLAGTGIERDERYFQIAVDRVTEAYRQPADMFVERPEPPKQEALF